MSCTVTLWVAFAELPLGSRAVQLTTVVPTGNPAGASLLREGAAHELSVAFGAASATGVSGAVALTVAAGIGTAIWGGVVSVTVTLYEAVELPRGPAAVHTTVVVPTAKSWSAGGDGERVREEEARPAGRDGAGSATRVPGQAASAGGGGAGGASTGTATAAYGESPDRARAAVAYAYVPGPDGAASV